MNERAIELETGFTFVGVCDDERSFVERTNLAFEILSMTQAIACAFTRDFAFVEDREAVHSPCTNAAVRATAEPWSPEMCAHRLWKWLHGRAPTDIVAARLPEGQLYHHIEPCGAEYPKRPHNESASGYSMAPLISWNVGIVVRPVWVRFGPFDVRFR